MLTGEPIPLERLSVATQPNLDRGSSPSALATFPARQEKAKEAEGQGDRVNRNPPAEDEVRVSSFQTGDEAEATSETLDFPGKDPAVLAEKLSEQFNDNLALRFERDEETGRQIFQLVDKETGDVVRQIPPQQILEFSKRFQEFVSGLLFSEQA